MVLRHSPFFFLYFGGYFTTIGGTFAKIRAKTIINRLRNRFYSIWRSIFITLEVVLRRSDVTLPRYGQKCLFAGFEIAFMIFAVLFLEL